MSIREFAAIEPFRLERYFAQYEFSTPLLLCASDCESMSVAELLALEPGATQAFAEQWLGYTESRGSTGLRSAVAGLYENAGADDVLVHNGAEEAIYAFVRAVLRPDDRVVVQFPCYQSLESVARSQGCDVLRWTPAEHGPPWRWSLDHLKRLAGDDVRAIVVNTPHNPTGYQMSEAMLRDIVAFADERNALLFCDEVYRNMEFEGPPLPAACDLSPRAISLGAMAKSFGLAGLRVGWIATKNAAVREAAASYKDYLTICIAAPSEFLATLALRQRETIFARSRETLARNRPLVDAFFRRHPERFDWELPVAGPIAYPRVLDEPADAFCARALARGVLLLPSTQYADGNAHVRVGFGRRDVPEALERLEEALNAPR